MIGKIFILATFILSIGNISEVKNEYHKEFYETGNAKAQGWVKDGIKTGYWRFYHTNGKLSEKGHFANNERSAFWYFYSKKGKLLEEGYYKNGTKADWWLFYDAFGNVNHKCQLSHGKKNGYCCMYKNNDIVKAKKYQDGKRVKTWSSFRSFRKENKLSDLR